MEEIYLKPCPFCGGSARLEDMGWPHHVYCTECGAKVTSTKYAEEGERDAARKWNTRRNEKENGISNDYEITGLYGKPMKPKEAVSAILGTALAIGVISHDPAIISLGHKIIDYCKVIIEETFPEMKATSNQEDDT